MPLEFECRSSAQSALEMTDNRSLVIGCERTVANIADFEAADGGLRNLILTDPGAVLQRTKRSHGTNRLPSMPTNKFTPRPMIFPIQGSVRPQEQTESVARA